MTLLLVLLAIVYALGPRVAVDTTIGFDAASIGTDPEAYLARRESQVKTIRPGLGKEIVRADPASKDRANVR